jgi:hypothetical protein
MESPLMSQEATNRIPEWKSHRLVPVPFPERYWIGSLQRGKGICAVPAPEFSGVKFVDLVGSRQPSSPEYSQSCSQARTLASKTLEALDNSMLGFRVCRLLELQRESHEVLHFSELQSEAMRSILLNGSLEVRALLHRNLTDPLNFKMASLMLYMPIMSI